MEEKYTEDGLVEIILTRSDISRITDNEAIQCFKCRVRLEGSPFFESIDRNLVDIQLTIKHISRILNGEIIELDKCRIGMVEE